MQLWALRPVGTKPFLGKLLVNRKEKKMAHLVFMREQTEDKKGWMCLNVYNTTALKQNDKLKKNGL